MSQVRVYKMENRLARVMKKPGGRSVSEALDAAQTRIDKVRGHAVQRIAESAQRLRSLAQAGRAGDCAAVEALYAASNDVFSLAGYFTMRALSEAAFSLCDLLTAADLGAEVDWAAVDVHVEAICLLCQSDPGADHSKLIEGLRAVRARYLATTPGPVQGRA